MDIEVLGVFLLLLLFTIGCITALLDMIKDLQQDVKELQRDLEELNLVKELK